MTWVGRNPGGRLVRFGPVHGHSVQGEGIFAMDTWTRHTFDSRRGKISAEWPQSWRYYISQPLPPPPRWNIVIGQLENILGPETLSTNVDPFPVPCLRCSASNNSPATTKELYNSRRVIFAKSQLVPNLARIVQDYTVQYLALRWGIWTLVEQII